MRTIALINQKGGVGKTTTAVNLGACLAALGKSVVLIDLDPQGNSSSWLNVDIYELEKSMFNVFHDGMPIGEILHDTCVENMWIAPSNVTLAAIERTLANKLENDTILKKSISPLLDYYDYIILDCPPSLGLLTVNALSAVKEVFIPLETKVLALNGLVTLVNTVNLVKDRLNPSLEVTGIIACMFDIRTSLSNKVVEKIRDKFHDKLFKSIIRESTQLAECPISGQPITLYAPDSRGTQDYMALAREVVGGEEEVERHFVEVLKEASQYYEDGEGAGNEEHAGGDKEVVPEASGEVSLHHKEDEEGRLQLSGKDEAVGGTGQVPGQDEGGPRREEDGKDEGQQSCKDETEDSRKPEERKSAIDNLYNFGEDEDGENE
jgi:chromosome partitioning protein